jgi:hypothetical protein
MSLEKSWIAEISLHLYHRLRSVLGWRSHSGPNRSAPTPQAMAEYYDLRHYQLASGPGTKLTDRYFGDGLMRGVNWLGIGPVGAFSVYFGRRRR